MTAELFPTEIRGIAHSISYSMANLLMFAALQSYRSLQAFLGGMTLEIFITHTYNYILSSTPIFVYLFIFIFSTSYLFLFLSNLNV